MSPVHVKIGGVWKQAASVHTKVGGVWKTAADMPVRVGGAWKSGILAAPDAFEHIQTITVGAGGAASVTFSSIPQTYKHLQIRWVGRSNRASTDESAVVRFNSDTGSNYSYHHVTGNGTSASSYGKYPESPDIGGFTGASATAGVFGAGFADILDYASTTKNKTLRSLWGFDNNSSGTVGLSSILWSNTSAVSTVSISPRIGTSFSQYSTFALYGVKG